MHEPTTDEKIQQLVRAVLEAVDSRLAAVRHELAEFAADMDQRHHQVLSSLAALEHRVDHLEQLDSERAGSSAGVRERLQELDSRVGRLEQSPTDDAGHTTDLTTDHTTDLSGLARPLYTPGPVTSQLPIVSDPAIQRLTAPPIPPTVAPMMSPTPTATEPLSHAPLQSAEVPVTPAPFAVVEPPAPVADTDDTADQIADDITEDIDIEQLKRILDERLSHLTLPPQPDA